MEFRVEDLISQLSTDWRDVLLEIVKPHQDKINQFFTEEYDKFSGVLEIFPPRNLIFNAFNHFDIKDLKIVLLSQDPFIRRGEAHGLSFSVPSSSPAPPSLNNIFKELARSYQKPRKNRDLTDWAKSGVLLLNASLSVLEGKSGRYMQQWKPFVTDILKWISKNRENLVYMLWGNFAKNMVLDEVKVDDENNLVLKHTHPSPLSRQPFTGCNHFMLANEYLKSHGAQQIDFIGE